MQQIKQSNLNYIHNRDWGNKKYKTKREKVQGARCMTEVNCSVIGNA